MTLGGHDVPLPADGWVELRLPAGEGGSTTRIAARLNEAAQLEAIDWDVDPLSQGPQNVTLCRLIFEHRTGK
ncbi:hypothetical protein [Cupriavidus numazuensis]|uniref:hypothetical protein n=1 Tax=Cupriavidus numazuensis TaxID=221992 RepID=UPI001BA7E2E0|nr:hypothetical protein [Cupriavidus numazuensis]